MTKLAEAASKRIGTPFHWGGRCDAGLDCWGLVVLSLRDIGIDIADPKQYSATEYDRMIALVSEVAVPCELAEADLAIIRAPQVFIHAHIGIVDGTDLIHASASSTLQKVVREPIDRAMLRVISATFRLG